MQKNLVDAVKELQKGNKEAFALLYEEFEQPTYFQISNLIREKQDIDDIMQDVFVTALEKIRDLKEPEAFPAWLKKIAVNKSIDYLRRQSKSTENEAEDNAKIEFFEEINPKLIPDKAFDNTETSRIIYEIIKNLPPPQKTCIHLYYYEELSVAEIAQRLEIQETTVRNRLALAREKIRKELQQREDENGLKLYAIPFVITPVLKTAMKNTQVPAELTGKILSRLGLSAKTTTAAATGTATAAKTAIGIKTIAGITIGVIVTTGITVGLLTNKPHETVPANQVNQNIVNENIDITNQAIKITEPTSEAVITEIIRPEFIIIKSEQYSTSSVSLDLSNLQLIDADIEPLIYMTKLQYLDLSFNEITDLSPLSELINLKTLDLTCNRIVNISSLSGLDELYELNLGYNNISDLSPLIGVRLSTLDLMRNPITDFTPLKEIKGLSFLNLPNSKAAKSLEDTLKEIYGICEIRFTEGLDNIRDYME